VPYAAAASYGPNDIEGIKIAAPHKVADIDPKRAKEPSYADGGTQENCHGYFSQKTDTLYVGEITKVGNKWYPVRDVDATVVHEVGHALDKRLGYISDSKEFAAAYQQDIRAMSASDRKSLDYYLPEGQANNIYIARKEAFAEIYANLRGTDIDERIDSHFPHSTAVIKERLSSLAKSDKDHVAEGE